MRIKRINILKTIGAIFGALIMTGCAADFLEAPESDGSAYDKDTQLVLNVAVPQSIETATTRAESEPDADECAISTLRLIAFNENGGYVNRELRAPSSMPVGDETTATYQIKGLDPGNYRIYVVANIPEAKLTNICSETQLKEVVLDYSSTLPEAGSLPMIYEPSAGTNVPAEGSQSPAVHTLSMQFACVKVKYNIIFDKAIAGTSDVFGDKGLVIKNVRAEFISNDQYLVKNAAYLPAGRTANLTGCYYDNYTSTPGNATQNNADVIKPEGAAVEMPSSPTSKWLWQGTVYLPERYATSTEKQTRLFIEGYMTDESGMEGTVRCRYVIPLGGYDEDPENKDLPRNTYYEVIGTVKTLGDAELDTKIIAKDWMEQNISADFVHTSLRISKTQLNVKSLEDDELTYETDGRGGVEIVCETKLPASDANGEPAMIFTADESTGKVIVKANPRVDIITLPTEQRLGKAKCYIKAGNIKKYFTVSYDIAPFFTIEQVALKIQYNTSAPELNTKIYSYRTNLGGILITADGNFSQPYISKDKKNSTVTQNGKTISLSCTDPESPTGIVSVTSNNNPGTTIVFDLDAYPLRYSEMSSSLKAEMSNNAKEDLSVTVMPPLGGYRIYFRAINDYHKGTEGSSTTSEFLSLTGGALPAEGGSNNWIDCWNNTNNASIDNDAHRIYIYTQFGETTGTEITGPVWRFTKKYNELANMMTGDANNPGWYYYDLAADQAPVSTDNLNKATTEQKAYYNIPRPGETLMIFSNCYGESARTGNSEGYGYTLHRASHHLDPGISLFDFEDREGYIVYDPTCEPYFFIFDEKPVIEDVTYTIYSDKKVTGWYKIYGNASNEIPTDAKRYTIWRNNITSTTVTMAGKTYYKTEIKLKCPRGEYAKAITVKFDAVDPSATPSVPQRVYLGMYETTWARPPRVYFYTDGGGEYKAWNSTPQMKVYPDAGGGNIYYYDVPAGFENGRVIFQEGNRNAQIPASDKPGFQLTAGTSKITYTNNTSYWQPYGEQPSSGSDNVKSVMFNGRRYPNNTGYFNTTTQKWSSTPN